MAARLKRRSSIGFGNRRDSLITAPDPGTPEMFTQDDDEERRVRNLQRRQAKNLEAGVTSSDSPAMERAGSSNRRSIGGISGLNQAQLSEHYANCIKLSSENKISTKNAFNLQLIDYMATMIKRKESDMNNFQVNFLATRFPSIFFIDLLFSLPLVLLTHQLRSTHIELTACMETLSRLPEVLARPRNRIRVKLDMERVETRQWRMGRLILTSPRRNEEPKRAQRWKKI